MKFVGLKIIKEILHKINEQDVVCLYVGIHFPFAAKYIKLLNIEENWLPIIFPISYKDLKEITFDQTSDYSTIDLWVVIRWKNIPESIPFMHSAQVHSFFLPLFENIKVYRFAVT